VAEGAYKLADTVVHRVLKRCWYNMRTERSDLQSFCASPPSCSSCCLS